MNRSLVGFFARCVSMMLFCQLCGLMKYTLRNTLQYISTLTPNDKNCSLYLLLVVEFPGIKLFQPEAINGISTGRGNGFPIQVNCVSTFVTEQIKVLRHGPQFIGQNWLPFPSSVPKWGNRSLQDHRRHTAEFPLVAFCDIVILMNYASCLIFGCATTPLAVIF